jgi:hypothetical protein
MQAHLPGQLPPRSMTPAARVLRGCSDPAGTGYRPAVIRRARTKSSPAAGHRPNRNATAPIATSRTHSSQPIHLTSARVGTLSVWMICPAGQRTTMFWPWTPLLRRKSWHE